jgi:hypothetical protein
MILRCQILFLVGHFALCQSLSCKYEIAFEEQEITAFVPQHAEFLPIQNLRTRHFILFNLELFEDVHSDRTMRSRSRPGSNPLNDLINFHGISVETDKRISERSMHIE